jgi:hypothetical protein
VCIEYGEKNVPVTEVVEISGISIYSRMTICIPSGNQTWQWKIPLKWRFTAGTIIEPNDGFPASHAS